MAMFRTVTLLAYILKGTAFAFDAIESAKIAYVANIYLFFMCFSLLLLINMDYIIFVICFKLKKALLWIARCMVLFVVVAHYLIRPPFIWICWPFMYAANSDAKNATKYATSSGFPNLRLGI